MYEQLVITLMSSVAVLKNVNENFGQFLYVFTLISVMKYLSRLIRGVSFFYTYHLVDEINDINRNLVRTKRFFFF